MLQRNICNINVEGELKRMDASDVENSLDMLHDKNRII